MKKVLVPCLCGKPSDFEYEEDVILDSNTEETILSGNFMTLECSYCGKILKPDFSIRFKNSEKKLDILYIPERERDSYLRGKSDYEYKKPDRVVIGYHELAEKIKVIRNNLDDTVIESVKYYILSKIENDIKPDNEILIYFNNLKDDKLVFEIHGLQEEEIGIIPIEKSFYNLNKDKLEENKEKEPFKTFLAPPYISLLKVYREYEENSTPAEADK